MSSELRVEQLRKVFVTGRPPVAKAAVDDVSFTIPAGEIVVLLGPSGCGKTTTLRCVAGLEHPTSGKIRIGGEVYTDPEAGVAVPPRGRNLGMVFQSYAVWPHMTVRQNVAYPLKARKTPKAEMDQAIQQALSTQSRNVPWFSQVEMSPARLPPLALDEDGSRVARTVLIQGQWGQNFRARREPGAGH